MRGYVILNNYYDSLKYQIGCAMARESWVKEIRKKYSLPDALPPMHMMPQNIDVLKEMHKQYPNDMFIANELIKEMESIRYDK